MLKGRELSIDEINNLINFSKVYIDYLDEEEFDLEYCDTVHINTFYKTYSEFEDYDGNTYSLKEVVNYINEGKIKLYVTDGTKVGEIKPKTNYEKIKSMTIEEMADYFNNRIDTECCTNRCRYYKIGQPKCEYKCTQGYIEWLMQEVE